MNIITNAIPYKYLIPGVALLEANRRVIFPTAAWLADKITGIDPENSQIQRKIAYSKLESVDKFITNLENQIIEDIFGSLSDLSSFFTPEPDNTNPNPSIDPSGEIVNTDNIEVF